MTHHAWRWFTIALLTLAFGQVWTKLGLQKSRTTLGEIIGLHNCAVADKGSIDEYYMELDKAGIRKSRTTLGEIVGLHNCAVADKGSIDEYHRELDKTGIRKSRTTLGEIVGLHNCAVADKGSIDEYHRELGKARITKIAYNFRRDHRTAQLCSCRQRINWQSWD